MTPDYDIAICGAGPVGMAFALLLGEYWPDTQRILLIDRRPPELLANDARILAISYGSRTLLERIDAWQEQRAHGLHQIHVSQRGHFGRTLIDRADYQLPALGYVIAYQTLLQQLDHCLKKHRFVQLRPASVQALRAHVDHVCVEIAGAPNITARYVVHAEGGLFNQQARRARHHDYGQSALTTFVTSSHLQAHTAWERFTQQGPIALLPTQQNGRMGYALVWCCTPAEAQRRMQLNDEPFLDELHEQFGDRVGRFTSLTAPQVYPLGLNASQYLAQGREFAIGNAAQTLHPVAGQGLNLGLRDAYTLAQTLRTHFDDATGCAKTFKAKRSIDRTLTINLIDLMPRVFASRLWPLTIARSAALNFFDWCPPARHQLARHLIDGQR